LLSESLVFMQRLVAECVLLLFLSVFLPFIFHYADIVMIAS
jgi:hypothetical protein